MNTIQVTTPCGVAEGFQEDGVNCFLGIPYATAKRFEYPQPVVSWKGICDAKNMGLPRFSNAPMSRWMPVTPKTIMSMNFIKISSLNIPRIA